MSLPQILDVSVVMAIWTDGIPLWPDLVSPRDTIQTRRLAKNECVCVFFFFYQTVKGTDVAEVKYNLWLAHMYANRPPPKWQTFISSFSGLFFRTQTQSGIW